MNSNTSHTACTDAHTLSAHHIALILCTKGQPDCVPKTVVSFHLSRAMSLAPHRAPSTSSSIFRLFQVTNGCSHPEIPAQIHGNAGVMDIPIQYLSQVFEPNRIVDNLVMNERVCTEHHQITEIEDHIKTLSYNQSLLSSTQDSIESIAAPQEANLDDKQIRALLASPRYVPEREASPERSHVYHSEREGLMSSASQALLNLLAQGDLLHCFHIRGG